MNSKLSILRGPSTKIDHLNIEQLITDGLSAHEDKDAIIFEENGVVRRKTYRELNNLANKLAKVIRKTVMQNGLYTEKDENFIIGVHMLPSDYFVITVLAILKVGAGYLPLDPNYPSDRIEYIVSDSKLAMVIYNKEDGVFPNTHKLCINDLVFEDEDVQNDFEAVEPIVKNSTLAIVLYTSGSTGHPKGVCVSHASILNRLRWQFSSLPFTEDEKICAFKTAITFADCCFEIFGPLLNGRTLLVLPKSTTQNPENLIEALEEYKIKRLIFVPTLLESILFYKQISGKSRILPHLTTWISSGETLSKVLVNKFYKHFEVGKNILCNVYGSTEAFDFTFYIIKHPSQLDKYESCPIGEAMANIEIYILDSNNNILPEGEPGDIYSSGINSPLKYLSKHNEDKILKNSFNSQKLFSRLCKTGDCGIIKDGLVFFLGRSDSVVKIRGIRVDLAEIEQAANLIEDVKKCVVLCYKPEGINQTILAFVSTTGKISGQEIEEILKTKLPSHMIPAVICIETFPLLISGKVDRQMLLKKYEENKIENQIDYTGVPEEQLPAAKVLFETVASVAAGLSHLKISLESNFFKIGGNSINSIYTITVLNDNGYKISISDFIKSKNLKEVLYKMEKASNSDSGIPDDEYTDYSIEEMQEHHKDAVFEILSSSFIDKSNIETLIEGLTRKDYCECLEYVFPVGLSSKLSFVVKAKDGSIIGASINYSADTQYSYTLNSKLTIVDTFFAFLEVPIKKKLLKEYKKIFYSFIVGTKETLSPQENVMVVHFMEQQIIRLAKRKNFEGVLTSNQTPITEDIGKMYGYVSYLDYQVNQYVAEDNTKPFEKAPDSQKVVIHFKKF